MLPVLLDLKFIKIYTFGIFLILAFFWSAFLLWKNIRLTSYKEEEVFDGLFISLGTGIVIGRLVHVALHFDRFGFDILKFILINGYPGFSLYGCVAGSFLGLALYCVSKRIKFLDIVDYFIPSLFLALGIGKLGSFFAGVEVGEKTKLLLAIKYAGFDGLRHLTPFYEAALFFLAAFLSYKFMFEIRRQKYTKGFNFYFFWWCLSFIYAVFDPLKSFKTKFYDYASFNAILSYAILLTFTVYFLYYFRGLFLGKTEHVKNFALKYGQKLRGSAGKKTARREDKSE